MEEEEARDEEEGFGKAWQVDWEDIANLWQPVIAELLEHGEARLSRLKELSPEQLQSWLRQKEAIDLWLMFYGTSLQVPELTRDSIYSDERLILLQKLAERELAVRKLEGRVLLARIEAGEPMIRWDGVAITPFVLTVKESDRG